MTDQARNWVWNYRETVRNVCKRRFPQDPQTAEDRTQEVLLKVSQKHGLDQVGDRSKYMRRAADNECMDYFRKLKRNQAWMARLFEDPGVGVDEKLSDVKLDKEASGSTEYAENKIDEPEKIDHVERWRSFKRHDPDRAAALIRSLLFIAQAFDSIKLDRISLKEAEQIVKLRAVLQDAKRRMDKISVAFAEGAFQDSGKMLAVLINAARGRKKIMGAFTTHQIQRCADYVRTERYRELAVSKKLIDQAKEEVIRSVKIVRELWRSSVRVRELPDEGYDYRSPKIFHFIDTWPEGDYEGFYWNSRRIRAFIDVDPDPLYVLYRVWNRILRKGKYANRKRLEVLLFAFKKMTAGWKDIDTFNSLTEETNLETLRTMSRYRLNKGYSELADFIYRKSVRPPKRKTTPTDEKKPAPPSSISSRL